MQDLTGKVVLITGAKGGLGTFVTQAFLNAGAAVGGVSRSIAQSDFDHPRFAAFPAELSSAETTEAVVQRAASTYRRIDALVHLMGAWAGGAPLEETGTAAFDRMLDVNLRLAFFAFSAAARAMRAQGSGRLLAIGSRSAVEPQAGSGAYNVAKAGLVMMVRSFAAELRDSGVTANIVLPGTMDTPQNRAANPDADPSKGVHPCHVAELLVYLASNAASSVNGAAIPVYGAEA
jgi:NAD(P)-dependent dehydrogenase (short-subunit alcohol dehydrogenase family)